MYNSYPKPFSSPCYIIILDILYLVFSVLYLIGDVDHMDNFLKYVKAVPVWIMFIQLCPLTSIHKHIRTIMVALLFGSAGDMFLLWSEYDICFGLGALSFLVGHVFYVTAFVFIAVDLIRDRVQLQQVFNLYPLFIILWLILLIFSFWSISTIITYLSSDDYIQYVLDVYGTILVLLVMGGFFFFFTTFRLSASSMWAGILFMFGSILFFASDNFIAHGKYNTWYMDRVSQSTNTYLIMVTYYVAQFIIGKGAFFVALHLHQQQTGKQKVETQFRVSERK